MTEPEDRNQSGPSTELSGGRPETAGAQQQDFPDWEKEHGIDYGDYLDSLLDPDDPLHEVARAAAKDDPDLPG